jgi:predicted nucleic acid-binding protein
MKLRKVLYDTSVYVSYKRFLDQRPDPDYTSLVVYQERIVSVNTGKEIKVLTNEIEQDRKANRLLVPGIEEWVEAGKILFNILREQSQSDPERRRPRLGNDKKQSIIRDALIAVSAKKRGVTVVSDNVDFPLIQRHYNFQWISAQQFFRLQ